MRRSSKAAVNSHEQLGLAAHHVIEALEPRKLLSVTLLAPFTNVNVAQDSSPTAISLDAHIDDPAVSGTTVVIQTPNGSIPIELSDAQTPLTVQNFLNNLDAGVYNNTLFYRSVPGFVIQGGDQVKSDGSFVDVSQFPSVQGEPGQSNVRGTIAMALSSGPDSGNTEYFINLADNSSLLDGSNDGGPFTVFGTVLYNGMTVADAISNLPKVDNSTLNSQLSEANPGTPSLPLETAGGGTGANNLVTTTISVTPHVFLNATTNNPSLVTPTIGGNNQLSLAYAPGASGVALVTVTGTDLGGNQVSQTFRVRVTGSSGGTVSVGAGGAKSATFHQPDGTAVTVSLNGPGTATLTFAGAISTTTSSKGVDVSGTNVDPNISITGGTSASKLTITTKGGSKVASIGDITTDAAFGTINAAKANLDGDLNAAGSVKAITLNGANHGNINVGAGGLFLTLKTSTPFSDEMITSQSLIKSITTPGFDGTNTATSGVTAPAAGTISVKGAVLNSAFTFTAGGGLNLASFSAKGDMTNSTIDVTGNIGAVSAATMVSDQIFAGVNALPGGQPLPNFPTDFASVQSIKSIRVKNAAGPTFGNDDIAAEILGSMSLGRMLMTNNSVSFGLAATKISSVSAIDATNGKKISLHNINSPAILTALEAKLGFSLQDFVIKIF